MISKDNKHKAIALTQVSKNDVGSPQAQVSVLTARIKEVTEHLKVNKHDNMARRGLIQMVGKLYKFEIEVIDSAGVCGRGTHTRAIVSTSRLIEGAQRRALANKN